MGEFKIDKSFSEEIKKVMNAGNSLQGYNKNISTDGLKTLPTIVNTEKERNQITALLLEYSLLIEKDAEDLDKMMESVTANDQKMAQSI